MHWWGPAGFTCPDARMDFREGGTSIVAMHSPGKPEWTEIYNAWHYVTIVPLESITYIDTLCDKNGNPLDPATLGMPADFPQDSLTTIAFRRLGESSTELIITKYHNMEGWMFRMAKLGMEQSLDKMALTFKNTFTSN
jgi:uncharacterized protein YndB with AHSA1/START domain